MKIADSARLLLNAFAALIVLCLAQPADVRAQDGGAAAEAETEASEDDSNLNNLDTAAEEEAAMNAFVEAMGWERSGSGDLGKWATVVIPDGLRFTGKSGTEQFLELTGNLPGGAELGIIAPEDFDWWALFEFDESGYVKDDDRDELDAAKMLKALQEGQEMANEHRLAAGLDELHVIGWAREPYYNDETNNLEWATVLKDGEGYENVNFNTRLLGRRGVMQVTLICDEEQLPSVLPEFQAMVAGFSYKEGQSYAEYKDGDKVAKYGLAALIVGGGAAVLAKTGLLAVIGNFFGKFFKLIIVGVVAVGVAIKRLFTGRSES